MIGYSRCGIGVVGHIVDICRYLAESKNREIEEHSWKAGPKRVIVPYLESIDLCDMIPSSPEHVKFWVNQRRPRRKAKYY